MAAMTLEKQVESAYALAQERYAALGVNTAAALETLATVPVSMHCWQGDDVTGFEQVAALSGGGIQATGHYPGKARNADELRQDAEQAFRLIPGKHRFNLHAMYAETGGQAIARNELAPEHFSRWMHWAKAQGVGLDFNPTCFAHPLADSGFTLSSPDAHVRQYWIEHCIVSRRIGAAFGEALGTPCVTNLWIPDGYKDIPADRLRPRVLLRESLDQIFAAAVDRRHNLDAVESKLFGIGSESYVTGSHEFYLAYALEKKVLLCLDAGHFHPTEMISEKIAPLMAFMPEMLLHVSRGVRWDSDHVVILNDELREIALELVRHDLLRRVHLGLDYFDASINRIAAWVIGMRALIKALLYALLEPWEQLVDLENAANYTGRLALIEEMKTLPFGAVWDFYCLRQEVPGEGVWLREAQRYEQAVLSQRV